MLALSAGSQVGAVIVWVFALKPFIRENKGISQTGANIGITILNDIGIAREIKKREKKPCLWIEAILTLEFVSLGSIVWALLKINN